MAVNTRVPRYRPTACPSCIACVLSVAAATLNVLVASPFTAAADSLRFARIVAVVPSSSTSWPVRSEMNCANTAAMMLDWRHVLLSCADCATPDAKPAERAANAAHAA
ncbi:hypothetical protein D3C87_1892900 [compost metagenome]